MVYNLSCIPFDFCQGKEECFNTTPRLLAEDLDRKVKSEIRYDIIDGQSKYIQYAL